MCGSRACATSVKDEATDLFHRQTLPAPDRGAVAAAGDDARTLEGLGDRLQQRPDFRDDLKCVAGSFYPTWAQALQEVCSLVPFISLLPRACVAVFCLAIFTPPPCRTIARQSRLLLPRKSKTLDKSGKSVQDSRLRAAIPRRVFWRRAAPETQNPPCKGGVGVPTSGGISSVSQARYSPKI